MPCYLYLGITYFVAPCEFYFVGKGPKCLAEGCRPLNYSIAAWHAGDKKSITEGDALSHEIIGLPSALPRGDLQHPVRVRYVSLLPSSP